ncbi:MAG: hypothetical protein GY762_03645 [Proteobacteria bacterium]|nr:hypothetical protein [Pseudomonadota bacterium]
MKNPALAQNTLSPSYITPLVELIVLSITTSLFLAIIDMLLFPDYVTSYISIPQRTIGLPLCTWGNLFPIVLVFSALLTGLRQLYFVRPVGAGMAARILSLAVIEIGIVTYSIWLSAYTFSGDSISASPFRMIFILVSAILVTSLFLLFLAVTVYPYFNRWLS